MSKLFVVVLHGEKNMYDHTNYGATVSSVAYTRQLRFHQYIPQADAALEREVERRAVSLNQGNGLFRVLDIGMGPGRLSVMLSQLNGVAYTGLDSSPEFVQEARRLYPELSFLQGRLQDHVPEKPYDALVLQGVWHHVPVEDRQDWFRAFATVTNKDGVIILSDEFLAPFESEAERLLRAVLFYSHIIAEALKVGEVSLARDEVLNLLADSLYDLPNRGSYTPELVEMVLQRVVEINSLWESGKQVTATQRARKLLAYLRQTTQSYVAGTQELECVDRGDYKTSIERQVKEFAHQGWLLSARFDVGPTQTLGGMGILRFQRK